MSEDYTVYEEFKLDEFLSEHKNKVNKALNAGADSHTRFLLLCDRIKKYFDDEMKREHKGDEVEFTRTQTQRLKGAILGNSSEVNYFKDKIREYLKENNLLDENYPRYYKSLIDGIFHQNWGLAGMAQWMELQDCTSAKITGDYKVFFLIDGKSKLMEQRFTKERFEQLRYALLLSEPQKSPDDDYAEVYLSTGERVAIYTNELVMKNKPAMVFRKYIIETLTFEEQARRGTIPKEIIPLFESMAGMGVNVCFTGPVRSGKSTMLLTYQLCEDKELEGVFIQTDPEIKINDLMPNSPIMSIIADGDRLIKLSKDILRSDADYVVMAEARDGYAFYIMVEAANKGTNHSKATMHLSRQEDFAYVVANKIYAALGGKLDYIISMVAKSFNYLIEMVQLPTNKSVKKLMSITEVRFDDITHEISYHKICQYDIDTESWTFNYDIGDRVRKIGKFENPIALKVFEETLSNLARKWPMQGSNVIKPVYSNFVHANEDISSED